MRISISVEAQADVQTALEWYLTESAFDAAEGFADEIERELNLLVTFPEAGHPVGRGARVLTLPKFPYSIIYRHTRDHLRVIAVAHHGRRPRYWSGRL